MASPSVSRTGKLPPNGLPAHVDRALAMTSTLIEEPSRLRLFFSFVFLIVASRPHHLP